jgi:hypothetical protein
VAVRAAARLPGVARTFTLPVGSRGEPVAPCLGKVAVSNL